SRRVPRDGCARAIAAARHVARLLEVPRGRSLFTSAAQSVRRRELRVLRQGTVRDAAAAGTLETRGQLDERRTGRGGRQGVRRTLFSAGVEDATPADGVDDRGG